MPKYITNQLPDADRISGIFFDGLATVQIQYFSAAPTPGHTQPVVHEFRCSVQQARVLHAYLHRFVSDMDARKK